MAKTQFNVEQLKAEAVKPLYAVAGAAELTVAHARGYALEAQKIAQQRIKDVQARLAKVDRDPKALQGKAVGLVNTRVEELQAQAKEAQDRFDARVKELQKEAREFPNRIEAQLNEAIEELNAAYADLAGRGEKFVAAIRKDGVKAVRAIEKAPASSSTRRSVTATTAARTGAKSTGTKSTGTKSTKSTAQKSAAKKAPAKKSTAKKAPAKKSTTRSTTAKKSTAGQASS